MRISDTLLPEFDHESGNTRRVLERVPEDRFDWKPHQKSPALGWLANHVATIPMWAEVAMTTEKLDIDGPDAPERLPIPPTRAELLAIFDKNVASARAAIVAAENEALMQPWTLLSKGRVVLTMPRAAVLRSFVMNHSIHHRAQLCVYLRLNDIPVPAIYGPSADEGQM